VRGQTLEGEPLGEPLVREGGLRLSGNDFSRMCPRCQIRLKPSAYKRSQPALAFGGRGSCRADRLRGQGMPCPYSPRRRTLFVWVRGDTGVAPYQSDCFTVGATRRVARTLVCMGTALADRTFDSPLTRTLSPYRGERALFFRLGGKPTPSSDVDPLTRTLLPTEGEANKAPCGSERGQDEAMPFKPVGWRSVSCRPAICS
jgi:hypothetical protein